MLRTYRLFTVLLLGALLLSACRPVQPPAAEPAPVANDTPGSTSVPPATLMPTTSIQMELKPEKITSQALAGNLLGDPTERNVFVLLPPSYATSEKRYPVVYVLPWGNGLPADNTYTFKSAMQLLLRRGEIAEMIIVVPDGSNKLGASQFRSSTAIGDYETYVTRDVVDYIDSHYRTLPTRDSRGVAGCSNGASAAMRLALKFPNIFSVVVPTDGSYDDSLDVWQSDVDALREKTQLPETLDDIDFMDVTGWYIEAAAGAAPDPNNPPFYCEMPFRIVDGHGEFVQAVVDKIVEHDAAHEARRYLAQPLRLQGILIRHGKYDTDSAQSAASFVQLLTDLGIDYEYVENPGDHCGYGWEGDSLRFMAENLAFEAQE